MRARARAQALRTLAVQKGTPNEHLLLDASWNRALKAEFSKPYFRDLMSFLEKQKSAGKTVFPPG